MLRPYICVRWSRRLGLSPIYLEVQIDTLYNVRGHPSAISGGSFGLHLSYLLVCEPPTSKYGFEWHLDFQKRLRGRLEIAVVLLSAICHLEDVNHHFTYHKYNSLCFHSLSIAPKTSDSVSSAKLFPFQRVFWGPHEPTRESK
jgi:hypothetical protein